MVNFFRSNLVLDLRVPDLNSNVKMSKLSLTDIQTLFSAINNSIFKYKCVAAEDACFLIVLLLKSCTQN